MNTTILNQTSDNVNTLSQISTRRISKAKKVYQKIDFQKLVSGQLQDVDLVYQKNIRDKRIEAEEQIKLIPHLLLEDCDKHVKKYYKHHAFSVNGHDDLDFRFAWAQYFNDVSLYFKVFTTTDIFLCNADIDDMKAWDVAGVCTKRQFRKLQGQKLFHASVLLQLIGGGTSKKYCCDSLVSEYQSRYVKQQEFIKNSSLVKENGEVLKLKDCIKTQEMHIAELINYVNTIDDIAQDNGMDWAFITLTLPPEHHPNPTRGDNSYIGTSPYEANKWYAEKVNLVRAKLAKTVRYKIALPQEYFKNGKPRKLKFKKFKLAGLKPNKDYIYAKVCEAHKDGCPHWHILLWYKPEHLERVRKAFFEVFPNLAMNSEKSFVLNNGEAQACTYIFKYITKTTSIVDIDKDIFKVRGSEYNTLLNSAFRSFNRIRGINFSGVKSCKRKFQFLARNYKRLGISGELADILENNDLKSFMIDWADEIENVYRENSAGNKIFIGVKLKGIDYIKSFFKMVKTARTGGTVTHNFRIKLKDKKGEFFTETFELKTTRRFNDGEFVTYDFKKKTFKNSYKRTLYRKIAKLNKANILSNLVLVNHNYTRESQKQNQNPKNYQTDWQNYDDWLRSKIIFNS